MKILITGSGGFVGKHLSESFARDGHDVIALFHERKPSFKSSELSRITLIQADLRSKCNVSERVDLVIHTAAAHPTSKNWNSSSDFTAVNIEGANQLVRYCDQHNPGLVIFLSTDSVYGEVSVEQLTEETEITNPNPYGASKRAAELIFQKHSSLYPVICLRLPGVVGLGNFEAWPGRILRALMKGELVSYFHPNSLFNNVTDLSEIKRVIEILAKTKSVRFEIFNLAAGTPMEVGKIIEQMSKLSASHSAKNVKDSPKKSFVISTEKLQRFCKFVPKSTQSVIEKYVKETLTAIKNGEVVLNGSK